MKKCILLLFALGIITLTACGGQTAADAAPQTTETASAAAGNTIIVNSSEAVTVVPDIAEVVYSVRTKAVEAADCQQKNNESVSQVIELLKGLNIEETSIQTSDYYMNPVYDYSKNTARITGYEATTTLTVSDLPIEGLSDILTKSVASGINTVQSISYQASQYDKSYQEALQKAVTSAHEKATVLAEAAGVNVGAAVSIREISTYTKARYTDNATTNKVRYSEKEEMLADTAGEIMPGEIKVEARIEAEYQLLP